MSELLRSENGQRLDAANTQLGKELRLIHSSLAIYRVIGLNATEIPRRNSFFGLIQRQSLDIVVLGLGKVFERQKKYPLCSIRGVFEVAKMVSIQNPLAAAEFVERHGVEPSSAWTADIDRALKAKRPWIKKHLASINLVRNTCIAHLQQGFVDNLLSSVGDFEDLLSFSLEFHSFINNAFLNISSHPTHDDRRVERDLLLTLKAIGVTDPQSQFPGA